MIKTESNPYTSQVILMFNLLLQACYELAEAEYVYQNDKDNRPSRVYLKLMNKWRAEIWVKDSRENYAIALGKSRNWELTNELSQRLGE